LGIISYGLTTKYLDWVFKFNSISTTWNILVPL